METEYEMLARRIRRCSACRFYDPSIEPLAAALPAAAPVPVMFVGENPSWAGGQDVPFGASTTSGQALNAYYLEPLGLCREQVWVTDLLKCRYPKEIYRAKARRGETIRAAVDTCAHLWLLREIALARPRVLVTLSDQQVYQQLRRTFDLGTPALFQRAVGQPHPVSLAGVDTLLFPMIHPDISRPLGDGDARKPGAREKWAPIHAREHIPALRRIAVAHEVG